MATFSVTRPATPDEMAAEIDRRGAVIERLETAVRHWREERGTSDPRDPDYSQTGMFVLHNCWKCQNGAARCVSGNPRQCEYPHARND